VISLDESNAIRAITIGVSTFIAIITISAVMLYYNTAKATVQEIGSGTDVAGNYSKYIEGLLVKSGNITGSDVKNILNCYYMDERVEITMSGKIVKKGSSIISGASSESVEYISKDSEKAVVVNKDTSVYNNYYSNIISESKFKITSVTYYDKDNKTDVKSIAIEGCD
jgi:hypothetical protein